VIKIIIESVKANADRVRASISGTGISVFSSPQALPLDDSGLNLSSYAVDKIVDNTLYTLFDIQNAVRGFYVEIDGGMTKTFLKDFLDFFERRLRYPILFVDDEVYFIVKNRLGPGEFEIFHAKSTLSDFSRLNLSNDVYDVMGEMENELDYDIV